MYAEESLRGKTPSPGGGRGGGGELGQPPAAVLRSDLATSLRYERHHTWVFFQLLTLQDVEKIVRVLLFEWFSKVRCQTRLKPFCMFVCVCVCVCVCVIWQE